ncbi:MAG: hypothetical protein J7J15_03350 [Candidatus Aenigmarchaeota archaeon]|nr:hypothetical protein [Candidatus Aenigmarchaeota archaeon]
MYEIEIIEKLSKMPVFDLGDVNQIIQNKLYAKKVVSKLVKAGKVKKIRKGLYTFYDDALLIATFLVKPSYISSVSALSYYHRITQIPKEVFCFTSKTTRKYFFIERINFYSTKFFFGFELKKYLNFKIPIATPEKALIDSIGKVPVTVIEDCFENLNVERMIFYLKKIGKSSIIKRIGYLLEIHNYDVFPVLRKYIDSKYIPLDPLAKTKEIKNTKWKIIT